MAEQKLPDKAQENEMKREKVRVVPIKYRERRLHTFTCTSNSDERTEPR